MLIEIIFNQKSDDALAGKYVEIDTHSVDWL